MRNDLSKEYKIGHGTCIDEVGKSPEVDINRNKVANILDLVYA